ncbi:MAG: 4Fe-4S binding protein [Bacteroidales bacterium]
MPAIIDKQLCPQSHKCPMVKICPVGAIHQVGFRLPTIDEDKCIKCGKCVRACGMGAVTIN